MFSSLKKTTVCSSRVKHSLYCSPTYLSNINLIQTHKFKNLTHQTLHHLLEKCSSMKELKLLHSQIILHGLANENLTLGKLISFCAIDLAGDISYAQLVFDRILIPNKFMYNSLIRGYLNHENYKKPISLYFRMVGFGILPNEFTLPFVLKACACNLAYWEAVIVHGQAIKLGIGSQVHVENSLINVYAVCGLIQSARQLFDEMSERTLVSWNSIIGGYSRMGFHDEAFLLFREMRDMGFHGDKFTLVNLLSICSKRCDLELGKCLHLYFEISGIQIDQILRNALLDMYAKCGDLHLAQTIFHKMTCKNVVSKTSMVSAYSKKGLAGLARSLFDEMTEKNVITWNSMISCYVQHGQGKEALLLFDNMCDNKYSSTAPDEATLVSVLSACSQVGDLKIGKKIHNYICYNRLYLSTTLLNSLIDMYSKCGDLQTAKHLFFEIPEKSIVSWNVIIRALALHGCGLEVAKLFDMMQTSGVPPDEITFLGLLSACSHSGLIEIGRFHFNRMTSIYNIMPQVEHYACMVDLLGRGGQLEEAIGLIRSMPMKPDIVIWGALLGASKTYGFVEIGKIVLKQLLELEPDSSGVYVLLSNMYCAANRWEDVKKIRKLMNDRGIAKCRAISFIEIDGRVTEFMVDDKRHGSTSIVHAVLDQLTDHLKCVGLSRAFFDAEEA